MVETTITYQLDGSQIFLKVFSNNMSLSILFFVTSNNKLCLHTHILSMDIMKIRFVGFFRRLLTTNDIICICFFCSDSDFFLQVIIICRQTPSQNTTIFGVSLSDSYMLIEMTSREKKRRRKRATNIYIHIYNKCLYRC